MSVLLVLFNFLSQSTFTIIAQAIFIGKTTHLNIYNHGKRNIIKIISTNAKSQYRKFVIYTPIDKEEKKYMGVLFN